MFRSMGVSFSGKRGTLSEEPSLLAGGWLGGRGVVVVVVVGGGGGGEIRGIGEGIYYYS